MRRVLPGDVAAVARVLLAVPPAVRPLRVERLIRVAQAADRYRIATGRAHPRWGTGSLMAAASGMHKVVDPGFDDDDYCRAWALTLEALVRHRAGQAVR